MKTLEKGPEKIRKICAVLRDETLQPAQKEAQEIIEEARKEAELLIIEAQKVAQKLHIEARAGLENERNVFQASLLQAAKQGLESLRQSIENKFFNEQLTTMIKESAIEPHLIANLINAIVKALETEGLAANLTALIPKEIPARKINELLLVEVLKVLDQGSVNVGHFTGGAQVKLHNKNMTIDISEDALKELLATYVVRKDFRKIIFKS